MATAEVTSPPPSPADAPGNCSCWAGGGAAEGDLQLGWGPLSPLLLLPGAALAANVAVCVAVVRAGLTHTAFNCLLVSLAVCDGLNALLVMPLSVIKAAQGVLPGPPMLCEVWQCVDVTLSSAVLVHLAVIAIDRCANLLRRPLYNTHRSSARLSVLAAWLLSLLLTLPPFIWHRVALGAAADPSGRRCTLRSPIVVVIVSALSFLLPFVVASVAYCCAHLALCWKSRKLCFHSYNFENDADAAKLQQQHQQIMCIDEEPEACNKMMESGGVGGVTTLLPQQLEVEPEEKAPLPAPASPNDDGTNEMGSKFAMGLQRQTSGRRKTDTISHRSSVLDRHPSLRYSIKSNQGSRKEPSRSSSFRQSFRKGSQTNSVRTLSKMGSRRGSNNSMVKPGSRTGSITSHRSAMPAFKSPSPLLPSQKAPLLKTNSYNLDDRVLDLESKLPKRGGSFRRPPESEEQGKDKGGEESLALLPGGNFLGVQSPDNERPHISIHSTGSSRLGFGQDNANFAASQSGQNLNDDIRIQHPDSLQLNADDANPGPGLDKVDCQAGVQVFTYKTAGLESEQEPLLEQSCADRPDSQLDPSGKFNVNTEKSASPLEINILPLEDNNVISDKLSTRDDDHDDDDHGASAEEAASQPPLQQPPLPDFSGDGSDPVMQTRIYAHGSEHSLTCHSSQGDKLNIISYHNPHDCCLRKQLVHNERAAVHTLGAVLLAYLLLHLPFGVLYFMSGLCLICSEYLPPGLMFFFEWLAYSDSLVNPLIYLLINKRLRAALNSCCTNTD